MINISNESAQVEEFHGVEILISSLDDSSKGENLFLKGDMVLSSDRVVFKGMFRMEYFNFYVKLYNILTLTRSSDYLVFTLADLTQINLDANMHKKELFESSGFLKDSKVVNPKLLSMVVKRSVGGEMGKSGSPELLDLFKKGKEFELMGNLQVRVIMSNKVSLLFLFNWDGEYLKYL